MDAPIVGVTYGITNRAQLSATIPFYRVSYRGFSGSGLDDVHISGKLAIVSPDASASGLGVAVAAVAEILSAGFAEGSRAHRYISERLVSHPVSGIASVYVGGSEPFRQLRSTARRQ
jgi:hypothetical protein